MMIKHGAPEEEEPQMGKVAVPWPSKVLVFKAQEGCFVPQPQVQDDVCSVPGCGGAILLWPDGRRECQKCGVKHQFQEKKP